MHAETTIQWLKCFTHLSQHNTLNSTALCPSTTQHTNPADYWCGAPTAVFAPLL
jgi:hypothetical protein